MIGDFYVIFCDIWCHFLVIFWLGQATNIYRRSTFPAPSNIGWLIQARFFQVLLYLFETKLQFKILHFYHNMSLFIMMVYRPAMEGVQKKGYHCLCLCQNTVGVANKLQHCWSLSCYIAFFYELLLVDSILFI